MSNSQIRKEEERIDNAKRRRLELIKNKDLIEKRIDELEDIYTKLKSLEPLNIDLFLLSDPNKFLKKCDGKIAEVEKRRVGLKMIYEAIEERIENLKQFPEIFDTEKGRELEKQFIWVGLEIDKCELEKGRIREMKDTHEKNIILENHIKVFLHNISKSNVIEWELNDLEYFLKESENKRTEFIKKTEEEVKKINEKISELEEIKTKMETMIKFVLPEKKVKEEKFEDSLKKVNNTISKYNELKNKIINRKTELENEIRAFELVMKEEKEKKEKIEREMEKAIEIIKKTNYSNLQIIEALKNEINSEIKHNTIKKIVLEFMDIHTEQKKFFIKFSEVKKIIGTEWTFEHDSNSLLAKYNSLTTTCHNELSKMNIDSSKIKMIIKTNCDKILKYEQDLLKGAKTLKKEIRKNKYETYLTYVSLGIGIVSGITLMFTLHMGIEKNIIWGAVGGVVALYSTILTSIAAYGIYEYIADKFNH